MRLETKNAMACGAASAALAAAAAGAARAGAPFWAAAAAALPVAAAAGWAVSRLAFRPLRRLGDAVDIAQNGDWNVPFGPEAGDEAGRLASAFDRLLADLRRAAASVDALSEETVLRRRSENELREREDYYRRLFEHSNDAVFIYDFDGRILDANQKACAMLGHSRDALLKIPFPDLQPLNELGRSKEAFKTGAQTASLRYESRFQTRDGRGLDVEISTSVVDLKKGILQSIASNITERKRMVASLRESEEKFRSFMETATDLMFITDEEGRFTYVNSAMLRALGYSREELVGLPMAELLDRENLEIAKLKRRRFVEWGEDLHAVAWETKTRRKLFGEMKATGIYGDDGRFQGMRGVFRDVTERKKVEASQRLAELGKLSSDMAHEVKNQIAIIATRAGIAKLRNPPDPELKKDIEVIASQCEQVNGIVKRLLLFSKPSRGDFKPGNLGEAAAQVVRLVEDQFRKHNVAVELRIDEGLPPVIMDEKQMQEVFLNLLRNAYEAMPDGGAITVRAFRSDEDVRVDVSDTGMGISETDLARIFDPFFTTKEYGTGLGLSVCYGVVQAHKGALKYASRPGKGTTASLALPAAEP